jgi:recombination protein RecA
MQKKKVKGKAPTEPREKTSDVEALAFIESLRKTGVVGDITKKIDFISTGSWVINRLIGDGTHTDQPGGIPRGYITEVYGDEGCGKSTLGLHIAKQVIDAGQRVVYADFEKSLRTQFKYIENIGLNISPPNFLHLEPDNFEDGVKLIGKSLVMLSPAVIIVDSVTTMLPKAAFDADADDGVQVGLHAKLTGSWLNWIHKRLPKKNCALVLINQLRSTIKTSMYDTGPKEVTSGGRAIRFYCTVRIHMRPTEKEQVESTSLITGLSEKKAVSQTIKVVIDKNKLDMPFKSGPIYIQFGQGIDNLMSLVELAINKRVIKKDGAWFSWSDKDSGLQFKLQGKASLKKHLEENPDILEIIKPKLVPSRDEAEMESAMKSLEAKGVENLTEDEKEELKAMRKIKGVSVDDLELSSEDAADLLELENAMGLEE